VHFDAHMRAKNIVLNGGEFLQWRFIMPCRRFIMSIKTKVTKTNWTEYFVANRTRHLSIDWTKGVAISEEARAAITTSLQRFQVGESGEGKYLKKYAAQTGDAEYAQAIDLFIAEENYHAQLLAQVLDALEAPLLQGHWSDAAFIVLRRFGGLHAELMILLVAELIAKRYYRVLQNATQDENIRLMCAQILRDENAHVAFHCDTLSRAFAHHSRARRAWTLLSWKSFCRFVCFLVACDHRKVLSAANVSIMDWMRSTNDVFDQAAHSIFDVVKTEVKRSVAPCLREGKKYF
jgi:hypothetical protein